MARRYYYFIYEFFRFAHYYSQKCFFCGGPSHFMHWPSTISCSFIYSSTSHLFPFMQQSPPLNINPPPPSQLMRQPHPNSTYVLPNFYLHPSILTLLSSFHITFENHICLINFILLLPLGVLLTQNWFVLIYHDKIARQYHMLSPHLLVYHSNPML